MEVLGALFRSWLEQLELDGKLPGEAEPELPSSLLWVLVLYAQHLDKVSTPILAYLMQSGVTRKKSTYLLPMLAAPLK